MKHLICSFTLVGAVLGSPVAQGNAAALYSCAAEPHDEAQALGLTLCDAAPTDALLSRADTENLQERQGALVLELEPDGVSAVAGFEVGDLIYRVGGVDVADARATAERLDLVDARADTVVNFLRGGRPYRIKLRRE